MALHRLNFTPGVNTQLTQTANNGGWFACNLIRWRDGLLEKLAGWRRLFSATTAGIVRKIHAYQDLTPADNLLLGTDGGPQLYVNGVLHSLGIVRRVALSPGSSSPPTLAATSGSTNVLVTDTAHGASTGQVVVFAVQTSVGGKIIPANTQFTITVISSNTYTFNMTYAAVSTATGTTPAFVITPNSTIQKVTLASHGYSIGDQFPVDQTTTYINQLTGGLVSFTQTAGTFLTVTNVIDANNFQFSGGPYGVTTSPISIQEGSYFSYDGIGTPNNTIYAPWIYYYSSNPDAPIEWSIDNLGQNALLVYEVSPLFVYTPPLGSAYSGRTTVNTTGAIVPIQSGTVTMAATATSKTITVTDPAFTGATNDTILISITTSVGGQIILAGTTFTITKTGATTYTFQIPNAATTSDNGTTPLFTITAGTTQQVTLKNFAAACHVDKGVTLFPVDQLTTYESNKAVTPTAFIIIPAGNIAVLSTIDADNFTFTGGPYVTGGAGTFTPYEGETFISPASATYGPWIQYIGTFPTMQQTWLGPLAQIANIGPSAPQLNTGMLVAMPQAQVIVWGTEAVIGSGTIDPLLLRFSDAGGYTVWTASSTNQAGSYRLGGSGTKIVGGLQVAQTILIWTDVDFWSMVYQGPPLVYSFTVIASSCGLIAPLARAQLGRTVYWLSTNCFFSYGDGGLSPVTCPVWDIIFDNLDTDNQIKCFAGTIVQTHEIWFFFPTIGGNGECDSYVKVNVVSNLWDYGGRVSGEGAFYRSSWIAENSFGNPLGPDSSTLLVQQHEEGYDDDIVAMGGVFAETGFADVGDGDYIMVVNEFQQDMKWFGVDGAMQLTFKSTNYPGEEIKSKGPYGMDSTNRHIRPRLRARQIGLRFDWLERKGFSARLGTPRIRSAPAGKRP